MLRQTSCVIFFSVALFTSSLSYAESNREFVDQMISQVKSGHGSMTFTMSAPPPETKTDKDKEIDFYEEGLSKEDIKLGKAIFKAMSLVTQREGFTLDNQQGIFLLISYARWKYKQDNETMDFIKYLKNIIDERYANMDGWLKYYEAFL